MTYDVKHLFTYLFVIYIYYLVRCLFRSLSHLLYGSVVFLLLNFKSALYIMETVVCFVFFLLFRTAPVAYGSSRLGVKL